MNQHVFWSPGVTLEQIEEQVIQKALSHFRGNRTQTASALGIDVRTIYNKLEKYELVAAEEKVRNEERKAKNDLQLARSRGIVPSHPASSYPLFAASPEPVANASAQPDVPMPQRAEVQEVLSPAFAEARSRKRG